MNISEYIGKIKEIHEQRGDIEVVGRFGIPEIEVLEKNEAQEESEAFDTCLYIG